MQRVIRPTRRLRGTVAVPGDKSISHRALLLSAIATGESRIEGLSPARDVASTARCLRALGVTGEGLKAPADGRVAVHGRGRAGLSKPSGGLDAGNSGTTMRLLAGLLAGQPFRTTLSGDASLTRRPMGRIIEPLERMGARIESQDGHAPLTIEGGRLTGIAYDPPVASAQVKSAVLLAGLGAEGATTVSEPAPTRDHTERLLSAMGADIEVDGARRSVTVRGCRELAPLGTMKVPGDPSSAAFLLAAATLVPEGELIVRNVGLNSTRTGFLEALASMGASVTRLEERTDGGEPVGDLHAEPPSDLQAIAIDGATVPRLIDELPMLAVVATQAEGTTVIRDAAELRVKETDRLEAVARNLARMGADVTEHEDGLAIPGPQALRGAAIPSYDDHRIAMAFAVAGLVADGPTTIDGAEWADVSFPGFFECLQQIARN